MEWAAINFHPVDIVSCISVLLIKAAYLVVCRICICLNLGQECHHANINVCFDILMYLALLDLRGRQHFCVAVVAGEPKNIPGTCGGFLANQSCTPALPALSGAETRGQ